MSGITNYFHGETARVTTDRWVYDDGSLRHVLGFSENPYRRNAFDYDSDVRIDPAIKPSDSIVYVRLDGTCGLWARRGEEHYPRLRAALDRRQALSPIFEAARRSRAAAQAALADCGIDAPIGEPSEEDSASELPTIDATFFISYSRWNALAARQMQRDLQHYANVKVWFDLARPGEAPNFRAGIEAWLEQAVAAANGFLVLLTRESLRSDWVNREVSAAAKHAAADPRFKVILVKMDNTPVPTELAKLGTLVDSDELWYAQGLNEAIFAALNGYEGRKAWIAVNASAGHSDDPESEPRLRYTDRVLPSGIARSLAWSVSADGTLRWTLAYESPDGTPKSIVGERGPANADDVQVTGVDFGIRAGDRIGAIKVFETPLAYSTLGPTVWMRSERLDLDPVSVAAIYVFTRLWLAMQYRPTAPDVSAVTPNEEQVRLVHRIAEMLHDAVAAEMLSEGKTWQPFGADDTDTSALLVPFSSLPRNTTEAYIWHAQEVIAYALILGARILPSATPSGSSPQGAAKPEKRRRSK